MLLSFHRTFYSRKSTLLYFTKSLPCYSNCVDFGFLRAKVKEKHLGFTPCRSFLPCISWLNKKQFYTSTLLSRERIGPVGQGVLDALVGNLLGDGYAEKRGNATRIVLKQSAQKVNYIKFLHKIMSEGGVCNPTKCKTSTEIGKSGKIYYSMRFSTFSFSQLNYLHSSFYEKRENLELSLPLNTNRFVKRVPVNLRDLLTPRGLAHWIMDDGSLSKHNSRVGGLRLSTESFTYKDAEELQRVILDKFNLISTLHKHRMQSSQDKPVIYIPRFEQEKLFRLVKPYFESTMLYKIL